MQTPRGELDPRTGSDPMPGTEKERSASGSEVFRAQPDTEHGKRLDRETINVRTSDGTRK